MAVDPRDPAHLLLGTDLGLMRSQSGGRSWAPEAAGQIIGAVFAVAFRPDGRSAIGAAPSGVFRFEDGQWTAADAPDGAAPARAIALGAAPDRVYLLGRRGLFASDDGGQSFDRVASGLPEAAEITALAVAAAAERGAARGGRRRAAWRARTAAGSWQPRAAGLADAPIDTIALDPAAPQPAVGRRRGPDLRSDDLGATWRTVGQPLAGTRHAACAGSRPTRPRRPWS